MDDNKWVFFPLSEIKENPTVKLCDRPHPYSKSFQKKFFCFTANAKIVGEKH